MVHEPKTKVDMTAYVDTHVFRFDGAYGEESSNQSVYEGTAAPLIGATAMISSTETHSRKQQTRPNSGAKTGPGHTSTPEQRTYETNQSAPIRPLREGHPLSW